MSWRDDDIDKMFKNASEGQSFEFKEEYWNEIEAMLPVNKRKGVFAWWFFSVLMIGLMVGIGFVDLSEKDMNSVSQHTVLSHKTNQVSSIKTPRSKTNETRNEILTQTESTGTLQEKEQTKIFNDVEIASASYNRNVQVPTKDLQVGFNVSSVVPENSGDFNQQENVLIPVERSVMTVDVASQTDDLSVESSFGLKTRSLNSGLSPELKESVLTAKLPTFKPSYFLELYGGLGQSWVSQTDGQNITAGYGFSGGIILPVNRFTFSVGLGMNVNHFDNLLIRERTKVYSFGLNIIENSYRFTSIVGFNSTLRLGYQTGRHQFQLSADPSIKIMSTVQSSKYMDGDRIEYSKGLTGVQFFNRFGLSTSIGYAYHVKENLQIGFKIGTQLLDQIKSDRILGTHTLLPVETQFFIRKTF